MLNQLVVRFETGDFNTGTALVTKIAEAADEANHHPDVDLRYPHVTVSLMSHDVGAITARDIRLARKISELAADAGVGAAAHAPDVLELALDTPDHEKVRPFWAAILGYQASGDEVTDPAGRTPNVWFQKTDSEAPDRQRWHLDVSVPHDVAQERIQAAHRRRRDPGQRQARPGVLGAGRRRRQQGLHLHLAEPRLTATDGCQHRGTPIPRSGTGGTLS